MCEEALILVKYFIETISLHHIKLVIVGSDVSEAVIEKATANVAHFHLGDYISIIHEDLFVAGVSENYHMVYTSAAVNDLFNWKLLYYALKCDATYYLFSKQISDSYHRSKSHSLSIKCKHFCNGKLNGSEDKRNIYSMNIPEIKQDNPNTLSKLVSYVSNLLNSKFTMILNQGVWAFFDNSRSAEIQYPILLAWRDLDSNQTLSFLDDILQPMNLTAQRSIEVSKARIKQHFTQEYCNKHSTAQQSMESEVFSQMNSNHSIRQHLNQRGKYPWR